MFQTKFIEKVETHSRSSVTFIENRAVSEIMRKNIVEANWQQVTMWR